MAIYDSSGNNIGRNSACPCGSGKKFKHCHGKLESKRENVIPSEIPEEVKRKIAEIQARDRAFKAAHGEGKPIITTEFGDWRLVAVGNELHYGKKEKTKYFPDFLGNYVRQKFGTDWGNGEIVKPFDKRH